MLRIVGVNNDLRGSPAERLKLSAARKLLLRQIRDFIFDIFDEAFAIDETIRGHAIARVQISVRHDHEIAFAIGFVIGGVATNGWRRRSLCVSSSRPSEARAGIAKKYVFHL